VLELEDLDARFGRVEDALVLERTRQLALQTRGAFYRIDQKRFVHDVPALKTSDFDAAAARTGRS
jgi:hypothetical protein